MLTFVTGCYAREMVLEDPVISLQQQGIKNVLFLGFNIKPNLKFPSKVRERLEAVLFKEFEHFEAINLVKADKKDLELYSSYKPEELGILAKKYKSELMITGNISDYKEIKYLDQPVPGFYRGNEPVPGDSVNLKSLVRFQIGIDGNFSLIKPDGKILWTQRIDEVESVEFEGLPGESSDNKEEMSAYVNTREKLVSDVTSKVIRNLLPYYTYK